MIRFLRDLTAWLKHGKPHRLRIQSITQGCGGAFFYAYGVLGETTFSVSSTNGFQAGDVVMISYGPSPLRKAWDWWGLK